MNELVKQIADLGVDATLYSPTKRSLKGGQKYGIELLCATTDFGIRRAANRHGPTLKYKSVSIERARAMQNRMWKQLEAHVAKLPESECIVRHEYTSKRVHFLTQEAFVNFVSAVGKRNLSLFAMEFWAPKLDLENYDDGVLTVSGVFHKPRTPKPFYVEAASDTYDVQLLKRVHDYCTSSNVWMNAAMSKWESGRDWNWWRRTAGNPVKYLAPAFGFDTITEACMLQLIDARLVKRIYQNSAYKPPVVNTVEETENEQVENTVSN